MERKDEVFVKYFEDHVKNKGEVVVQERNHKGKGFDKADETHKKIHVQREEEDEKKPTEAMHISTPPGDHTFKRLIRQLKESRKEVAKLKKEAMSERVKMTKLMDGYSHTIDLARFAARRTQTLHRHLQNLYRQNKGFEAQNRKLKAELKNFQDEVSQRNL